MANCPCENEASTCVDATAPLTRNLSGGCVEIGFEFEDGETVNFGLTGGGALTAEATVSPDADNLLQALTNGLYVAQSDVPNADEFYCGTCTDSVTGLVSSLDEVDDVCNGLRLRTCLDDTCEGAQIQRLWAPPPVEHFRYFGIDTGDLKHSPFEAADEVIPAGLAVSGGTSRENLGYILRTVPWTDGSTTDTAFRYRVDNNLCSPAYFDVDYYFGAMVLDFQDINDTWDLEFFIRHEYQDTGGGINYQISGIQRVTATQQPAANSFVNVVFPSFSPQPFWILPTTSWFFKMTLVCRVMATGTSDVDILNAPQIRMSGNLNVVHKLGGSVNVGLGDQVV